MNATEARRTLAEFWRRNGYLKDRPARGRTHSTLEARVSVAPGAELKRFKQALAALGIPCGHPFEKSNLLRVPVYGRDAVEALLAAVGEKRRRWRSASR